MAERDEALAIFAAWYAGLRQYGGGFPARGTIAGALVVLEQLKANDDLSIETYTARGGAQIVGASGAAVASILARFGETRPFLSEGGRTNRGLRGDIAAMLAALRTAGLDALDPAERAAVIEGLQRYLVERVRDYHNRQRLRISYAPAKTTWQFVRDLLTAARDAGKEGQVAQYLVGAKLALRFPRERIDNFSYSTADQQLGRPGDFALGGTAFHVTVSPLTAVYERCRRNLAAGYGVYLLVPEHSVVGAKQNAEATAPGRIAVEAIESFVAQNLDELATFGQDERAAQLRLLIETYNRRVDAVERDKSLLIELPPNLE
jgi:hypothetical protein